MSKRIKITPVLLIFIIVLCIGIVSCTPPTTDTSELFNEINRLEGELEIKDTEIGNLKKELENAKVQLQDAQDKLDEKDDAIKESPVEEELAFGEEPYEFKLGDIIEFSDLYTSEKSCSVIVYSISNFNDYDKYSTPDEGMRYVTMDIEVENLSSEVQGYNGSYNYALRDADSYRYDGPAWGGKAPELQSGDLAPGDKVRGWVTIQLPEDIEITHILVSPCYVEPPAIIKLQFPLGNK